MKPAVIHFPDLFFVSPVVTIGALSLTSALIHCAKAVPQKKPPYWQISVQYSPMHHHFPTKLSGLPPFSQEPRLRCMGPEGQNRFDLHIFDVS
jgi:hypothetical protein